MNLLQRNSRRRAVIGKDGSTLFFLIIFNVILYVILTFIDVLFLLNNSTEDVFKAQILSWFSLAAQPSVFSTRPWTLLTFMFTHFGFWDLFSAMAWLFGFGFILKELTGNKLLGPVYLYGGFIGGIVFLLTVNLLPSISANVNSVYPLIGSGPATMALAVAVTTISPDYRIFPMIKLPLWAVTIVFSIIKIGSIGYGNIGHIAATVGGGLMGYIFIWQLNLGNDIGQWMHDLVNWINNLFNPEKKQNSISNKDRLYYKTSAAPFEKKPQVTQKRVDELLDKINMHGYETLTAEEKAFLKKASREGL